DGFPLADQRALIDAKRPDLAGTEIRSRDHAVGTYRGTAVLELAGRGYHGREQQHEPDQCTRSRTGSASSSTMRLHPVPPHAPLRPARVASPILPPRTRARMNCTPPHTRSTNQKGDECSDHDVLCLSCRQCSSSDATTTSAPSTSPSSIHARSVWCGSVP